MKVKLEATEDSLSQALSEMDSAKKAAFDDGYQKGFNAATASYVDQMPVIQDQIWAACWEACLTKVGVAKDSLLWVENDLPNNRAAASHDPEEHPEDDVDQQIDESSEADEDIPREPQDAPTERSPVREATNETINLEENVACCGHSTEVNTEVPSDTPPEV